MISWLKGRKIENFQNGNRAGLLIECSGIGYEVQVLAREISSINKLKDLILWVHQIQREDGSQLFGFLNKLDRDLFRKFISINGVGAQLAISLLEKNQSGELILAISNKDMYTLTACPGIGKKTSERIIIELHNKLSDLSIPSISSNENHLDLDEKLNMDLANEVRSALLNLDYENHEINKAFKELQIIPHSKPTKTKQADSSLTRLDFETLLKETLLRINKRTG